MEKKDKKRLYRTEDDSKLFGVCGGIAEYFDLDSTIIRVAWIFLTAFCGAGVLAYLICAICMPKKSELK